MNSKLVVLLSLVFASLLLNSYFLSQNTIQNQEHKFKLRGSEEEFQIEWTMFETMTQPSYRNEHEENYRKQVFQDNFEKIIKLNEESEGKTVYSINSLADKTQDELKNTKFGIKLIEQDQLLTMDQYEVPELKQSILPPILDWRKTLPPRIKNQGACGSCWAQAAAQALEGLRAVQNGVIEEISVQHILDCVIVKDGCQGHNPYVAFLHTAQEGVLKEETYPYKAVDNNKCPNLSKLPFKNKGSQYLSDGKCESLKAAVQQGPVAVYLAAGAKFLAYQRGILEDLVSKADDINHAVLLVGYTEDYWIVRNSWGDGFGMKGYYHIKMGNHAQICKFAFVPTKDPQYTTVNGLKPSYTVVQDSTVIDNTIKINLNLFVDKTFALNLQNKACSNGGKFIENQENITLFNPSIIQTGYKAFITSKIDFQVTGIGFHFMNDKKQTMTLKFERTDGGKAKALGLKYGDELYMVQCAVTTGAPQVVLDFCKGKNDKNLVFYRTDSKGTINNDCTFGLAQFLL